MSEDTTSDVLASAKQAVAEQRYEDAIAELTDLSKSKPDDPDILGTLGAAHAQAKNYPQAMAYLSKALSILPSAKSHYNLATLLVLQGKKAEAADQLEAALKLDPTYERARQMLAQVGVQPAPAEPTPVAAVAPPAATEQSSAAFSVDNLPNPSRAPVKGLPTNPTAGRASVPQAGMEVRRNWGKVIGGGVLIGLPFLVVWSGWAGFLGVFMGIALGAVASLVLLGFFMKWLSDSAGAFEIQHWVAMILLTGLLPSLMIVKGFDILAAGWYNMAPTRR